MGNKIKDTRDMLLYRQVKSVKAGQTERFKITYVPEKTLKSEIPIPNNLWVKIKNKESIALRAAYLAGPHVLYVDCKPEEYDPKKKCFITAEQPVFEPQLLPGQSFYAELSCHIIKEQYCWTVDVTSQVIFNNTICVDFEITIGTSRSILHDQSQLDKSESNFNKIGTFVPNTLLRVLNQDTYDLWNLPLPNEKEPIHLVILTHGLHSNVSADMLYLKEQIDTSKENIVVKGFFGNVGKTERGIKYLGSRVAEFIIELVTNNDSFKDGKVSKISFIGHSLGGLVQTFAIAYIENNFPWFFQSIKPINFITLASPLLGVVNENPMYVKIALSAGIVGKTGQDLGLMYSEKNSKPLLLLLPTGPTHKILKSFLRRTVYSNVKNDGIVPLRTSSLLFLDYKGISQIIKPDEKVEQNKTNGKFGSVSFKPLENEDTSFSPMQAMLSYFMPQKRRSGDMIYHKFQTMSENDDPENHETFETPPRSSVLETATSLILPPLPSLKYITDPNYRDDVILHDKIYSECDLPPKISNIGNDKNESDSSISESASTTSNLRKRIFGSKDFEELEETIAREYHKNMTWRKVLVQLKPDAHNNIIVRRRFANAYGWSVIEHLVKNHFDVDLNTVNPEVNEISKDPLDNEVDLSSILSRDLNTKQNNDIDIESNNEETDISYESKWINSKDNSDSVFAVGPTGLLSDVSEMVGNLRDHWYNYAPGGDAKKAINNLNELNDKSNDELNKRSDNLGYSTQVMGNFI